MGIELEGGRIRVGLGQVVGQISDALVEFLDLGTFLSDRLGRVRCRLGCELDRGHIEEEEVACTSLVELVDKSAVHLKDRGVKSGVLQPPAVADIIDAKEESKEGVFACPRYSSRLVRVIWQVLLLDLILEGQDSILIWLHQGRIDSGTTVGKVNCLEQGLVPSGSQEVNPIGSVGGCVATTSCQSRSTKNSLWLLTGMPDCRMGCQVLAGSSWG